MQNIGIVLLTIVLSARAVVAADRQQYQQAGPRVYTGQEVSDRLQAVAYRPYCLSPIPTRPLLGIRLPAAACRTVASLLYGPSISLHPHDTQATSELTDQLVDGLAQYARIVRDPVVCDQLPLVLKQATSAVVTHDTSADPLITGTAYQQLIGYDTVLQRMQRVLQSRASSAWRQPEPFAYSELADGVELTRRLAWRVGTLWSQSYSLMPSMPIPQSITAPQLRMRTFVRPGSGHEDCIVRSVVSNGLLTTCVEFSDGSQPELHDTLVSSQQANASWMLLFDGHACHPGHDRSCRERSASPYCDNEVVLTAGQVLNATLTELVVSGDDDPLVHACEHVREYLRSVYAPGLQSGTTLTAFLRYKDTLTCAFIGDSSFVVVTPVGLLAPEPHRLTNRAEAAYLASVIPEHELLQYIDPVEGRVAGLGMTRSLGDYELPTITKDGDCYPLVRDDIVYYRFPATLMFDAIIAATDGLWDEVSQQVVVSMVEQARQSAHPAETLHQLLTDALARLEVADQRRADDRAIVVITPVYE